MMKETTRHYDFCVYKQSANENDARPVVLVSGEVEAISVYRALFDAAIPALRERTLFGLQTWVSLRTAGEKGVVAQAWFPAPPRNPDLDEVAWHISMGYVYRMEAHHDF